MPKSFDEAKREWRENNGDNLSDITELENISSNTKLQNKFKGNEPEKNELDNTSFITELEKKYDVILNDEDLNSKENKNKYPELTDEELSNSSDKKLITKRKDIVHAKVMKNFIIACILFLFFTYGNIEFEGYDSFIEDLAEAIFGYRNDGFGMFVINSVLIALIIGLGYRQLLGFYSQWSTIKELNYYLKFIKLSSQEDLAEIIIFGSIVREKYKDSLLSEDILNSLNIFYIDERVDMTRLKIVMANNSLVNDANNAYLIAGNNLWLMTLRATLNIDTQLIVKEIWNELEKGFASVDKKINEMENNGIIISDWVKENYRFRPKI